jgi:3-phenylpropionate/trans-cinnamate dioxygenase ferredoxin subunit
MAPDGVRGTTEAHLNMNEYIDAGAAAELEDGAMKTVKAGEREILIARVGERYFAAQSRCPHMRGELSQGTLEGTIVTCPVHHSRFDLADGRMVRWTDWSGIVLSMAKVFKAPRPLTVYEAKVEDGRILVGTEQKPLREPVPAQ